MSRAKTSNNHVELTYVGERAYHSVLKYIGARWGTQLSDYDTCTDMMISIQITDFAVENQLLQNQYDQYEYSINIINIDGDVSDINIIGV